METKAVEAVAAANKADVRAQEAVTAARAGADASRAGTTAAVGAMRNSAEASLVVARSTVASFWQTTTGRVVKWGTAVAAVGGGIAALPPIAKFLERFWDFIRGTP